MHQQDITEALKERRKSLSITQEHLAELAGVGLRTIKAIESGEGNPTLETVLKIADVLGMKLQLVIHNQVDENA
jgi:y4mF family transcriptional regulator